MDVINTLRIGWKTQTDEGVPPEELAHRIQNRAKKEETIGSGVSIVTAEQKVKIRIKPNKSVGNTHSFQSASWKVID